MRRRVCPATRWAWVEINQQALRRNVRALKNFIGHRTRMMAVVKADAYGHGAVRCAKIMRAAGVDQFAVATVQEAIELREGGVKNPILILSEPPMEAIELVLAHDLRVAVCSTEFALALGECAARSGTLAKYHLAVETGMNRAGIAWDDVVNFREKIDFHSGLECVGTFTHFATADVVGDWDFGLQLDRFRQAVQALRDAGFETGLVHCDNTPGTILHPEAHFDMVRVGLGLYGLQASSSTEHVLELEPVMSVRARITRVAMPEIGAGVSYGMTYRVPRHNIQIATVPMGYADGLSRTLSGRMNVLIDGQACRQVGAICMDAFMVAVDINTIRPIEPAHPISYGDVVTIIGSDGAQSISLDDMAALRGTINYEVACDFGMRLEKVYV